MTEHVVLLHGISKTAKNLRYLDDTLHQAGYRTHNIHYPSTRYTIEMLASHYLHPAIQKLPDDEPLHFVTHSMGGIVLRQYLQQHHLANAGRIVMLAPPNHGSPVSQFFKDWWLYRKIYGPAGQQLICTGQNAIWPRLKPIDYDIGIITGNWTFECWFACLFDGDNDGKVAVDSARLDTMQDFLVLPFSHGNIVRSQQVAREILRFLQTGAFSH